MQKSDDFKNQNGKRQNRQKRMVLENNALALAQKIMVFENYSDRQHWRDKFRFWKTKGSRRTGEKVKYRREKGLFLKTRKNCGALGE